MIRPKGLSFMQATRNCIPQTTPAADDSVAAARPEDVALLFGELRRPLLRYLLSLSLAPAEAEDVVQETFLRLCENFTAGACFNLRAWIFRVAHNLARDQQRRRMRAPSLALESEVFGEPQIALSDPRATPEQQVIEQQRAQRLEAALLRLPNHQQQCLHLRAEGLRYREIAEVLGVGTSTVADWVQAALERLGREMQ